MIQAIIDIMQALAILVLAILVLAIIVSKHLKES